MPVAPAARWTQRLTRPDATVPVVSWLVAVTMFVVVSSLAALDPAAADLPATGSRAWWLVLLVLTAQGVALGWRRRHAPLVLWLTAAGAPAAAAVGVGDGIGATSVAVMVAAYTVAAARPARGAIVALVGAGTVLAAGSLLAAGADASGLVIAAAPTQAAVVVGTAAAVGVVVRTRREAAEARASRLAALSREHDARVEAALARERASMARELHDIAAHHLSGIAVMAGAIVGQIDADPEAAKTSVRRVRTETTAMLAELRSLVRLLRDAHPAEGGVETLAAVPALVERVRASGVAATLTVLGTPDGQPPADAAGPLAQLAAFRTVQECLANVIRHAPGARCEVVLDAGDPAVLRITVRNGPPAAPGRIDVREDGGGGLGLVGMRERAELTGAHLSYGPEPDGGWLVQLEVPSHPAPDLAAAEDTVGEEHPG